MPLLTAKNDVAMIEHACSHAALANSAISPLAIAENVETGCHQWSFPRTANCRFFAWRYLSSEG